MLTFHVTMRVPGVNPGSRWTDDEARREFVIACFRLAMESGVSLSIMEESPNRATAWQVLHVNTGPDT